MASTRLTNDNRESIVNVLLRHTFDASVIKIAEESHALADEVFDLEIGANKALYMSVPGDWLPSNNHVTVNARGWSVNLMFRPEGGACVSHLSYSVPFGSGSRSLPRIIDKSYIHLQTDGLIDRVQRYSTTLRDLATSISEMRRDLGVAAKGFRTFEAACAEIPELKVLLPNFAPAPKQAVVSSVAKIMCKIASIRGEEREGCAELMAVPVEEPAEV